MDREVACISSDSGRAPGIPFLMTARPASLAKDSLGSPSPWDPDEPPLSDHFEKAHSEFFL